MKLDEGAALVVVLPPPPAPVPPLDAEPDPVTRCAEDLLAASAQVDDLGGFARGGAQAPSWQGRAATAYRDGVRVEGARADALSLALRHVSRRVLAHADALRRLQRDRADLVAERGRLLVETDGLAADATGADASRVPALRARAHALGERVDALDHRTAGWTEALAAAEEQVRHAFETAGSLEQVEQHWSDVPDPADSALDALPPAGSSPEDVHRWWLALGVAQRLALVAASPGSIGNLDGIPAAARDQANRVALSRDLQAWERLEQRGLLTDSERTRLAHVRAVQDALDRAEDRLDPRTGEPVVTSLYLYDPAAFGDDGRVALAYGDPDTADHVSVLVPGMGTDMGGSVSNADSAWNAYDDARSATPDTVATIAWLGYDAPDNLPFSGDGADVLQVADDGLARAGGERLADLLDGLDALRDDDAHVSVVGHSYGSTTTSLGATGPGLDAGDLVLIGSPGAGDADTAADLGVGEDHVWVGSNSSDPVARLGDEGWVGGIGTLGQDPAQDDFGGTRFQAEDPHRHDGFDLSRDQHTSYYEPGTESLHNISQVIIGHYDDVAVAEHRHDPWYWTVEDPEAERPVTPPSALSP